MPNWQQYPPSWFGRHLGTYRGDAVQDGNYISPRTEQFDPQVVRRRPTDVGTIYGHSRGLVPVNPRVLSRPDRNGVGRDTEGRLTGWRDRVPSIGNDTLIIRQRAYLWRRQLDYIRPGDTPGNHSWVADGPIRDMPTTRFNRNVAQKPGAGLHSMADWGLHTNIPTGQKIGNALAGKSRMRPAAQNRLTVQRYRGQSYSATTEVNK